MSRPTAGATAEEIAVVTAAARALLTARVAPEVRDETPAWRFSGRWFGRASR